MAAARARGPRAAGGSLASASRRPRPWPPFAEIERLTGPAGGSTVAAMSLYHDSVVQMSRMLRNLAVLLDKAGQFAEARGASPDVFVGDRLHADMRPFEFQIQAACDAAKFAAARLAGVEPPKNPDTEKTLGELKARIAATLEFLDGLGEAQFAGAEDREVRLSFLPGKGMRAADYLREMALPNFYFHATMAYALLRAAGVQIGKRDFITTLTLHDTAA